MDKKNIQKLLLPPEFSFSSLLYAFPHAQTLLPSLRIPLLLLGFTLSARRFPSPRKLGIIGAFIDAFRSKYGGRHAVESSVIGKNGGIVHKICSVVRGKDGEPCRMNVAPRSKSVQSTTNTTGDYIILGIRIAHSTASDEARCSKIWRFWRHRLDLQDNAVLWVSYNTRPWKINDRIILYGRTPVDASKRPIIVLASVPSCSSFVICVNNIRSSNWFAMQIAATNDGKQLSLWV